jgi:hypothetical protein
MSEYQYYEFQAVDRPLTADEMAQLRSCSTRARITPTSFVNEYHFGSFKGDADAWMERYFDAHLYFANWGSRELQLRLPARLLDPEIARRHAARDCVSVRLKANHVILSFQHQCEDGGEWEDADSDHNWMARIIPVRADLARGDLRALYLGWLLGVQDGALDEDAVEPPVPAGLGQLSASLQALADFLRLNADLLAVAAESSPARDERPLRRDELRGWLATLPADEKDDLLARLIAEADAALSAELHRRFVRARDAARPKTPPPAARRTVGELLRAAEARTAERHRLAAEKAAADRARHEREAALARARHLERLAGQEATLWTEVERLVATRLPKDYDTAVGTLVDLRDLAARANATAGFQTRLAALRATHVRKTGLLDRLARAGL